MKLKYYLRGFGTGVIFATIILMVALEINKGFTSDENSTSTGNSQTTESVNESKTGEDETLTVLQNDTTTLENPETEPLTEPLTEPPTEPLTEPQTEPPTDPQTEPETTVNNSNAGTVTFVITKGMTSNTAADKLEELGVVENGYDFNMYLYNNGYESKLRVGSYEISKGASYEEITRIITGR